jgi:hypothetical protein
VPTSGNVNNKSPALKMRQDIATRINQIWLYSLHIVILSASSMRCSFTRTYQMFHTIVSTQVKRLGILEIKLLNMLGLMLSNN